MLMEYSKRKGFRGGRGVYLISCEDSVGCEWSWCSGVQGQVKKPRSNREGDADGLTARFF